MACTFASGTGSVSPHRRSKRSPNTWREPATRRVGSTTWRAPRRVHPHLQARVLRHQRAGRAAVVEVHVRQQQVAQVADLDAVRGEAGPERRQVRAGAAVDERRLAVGQQVGGVEPARPHRLAAEVERQHADPPPAAARTAATMRP